MTRNIPGSLDWRILAASKGPTPLDDSRGLTELSVTERVRILSAQGLRPRDISSMLHIHPQMVLLLLAEQVSQ